MSIFEKTAAWFKGLSLARKQLLAVAFLILLNYQLAILLSAIILGLFIFELVKVLAEDNKKP